MAARAGKIPPQTQSSIAFTCDSERWLLINASPDIGRQIENTPELQPKRDSPRNSPIAAVFLTNADLDHALGLLLLRERDEPLAVYASDTTREALRWLDAPVERSPAIRWRSLAEGLEELDCSNQSSLRPVQLGKSIAFEIEEESTGKTMLIAPVVGELNADLHAAINRAEVILFDGTFWSDDELRRVRPGARRAREMNHLPISDGSLELLRAAPARRKIYIHINNTNPIWMRVSPERQKLERAGIEVGYDGLELTL